MDNRNRALMNAPCGYEAKNHRGESYTEYPAVDCSNDCARCAWNPAEVERRYAEGRLITENGVRTLHFKRA